MRGEDECGKGFETMKAEKASAGEKREHGLRVLLSLLIPVFLNHKKRLIFGFAALLLVDFLQLMIPKILRCGVDGLENGVITELQLGKLALLILTIALIVGVLRFVWRILIIGFSRLLERDIRQRIFTHILKMDMAFFEQQTTGKIMAHMSNDLTSVQMACGMGMVAAIDGFVMSAVAIIFMMMIDVKLTLLALLPMPFLILCTRVLASKMHRRFSVVQDQFGLLTEFVRSTLVSIRLIKAYGMEGFQTGAFDALGKKYVNSNLRVAMIHGLMFPVSTLVGNAGLLLVLYFGGGLVIDDTITIGEFVAFVTYLYMLIWPIMAVGWVANLVQRGLTSLDRIYTLLQKQPILDNSIETVENETFRPCFDLRGLSFSYPGSDLSILQSLDLKIEPGILGVTGPTGSGKSTLCKILSRLYPVADNRLLLDGHDVNALSLDTVRSMIGYVGQEPMLFSDTILANIRFGRPDAPFEQVQYCAEIAGVHGDIMAFSDGYDAVIGERGVTLSGGQRQRVALARALLYDREVLLIDDGLSAVDVETENQVLEGLKKHLEGKTVVIISHRIKLLSMTDRVVILDEGRISGEGKHEELLATSGFYRTMYEKQIKEEPEVLG